MNKLADNRRDRLRAIIHRDGLTAAARRFKRPESQLSDMVSDPPRKAFGEKIARLLEANYGLDEGFFDTPDTGEQTLARNDPARQIEDSLAAYLGRQQKEAVKTLTPDEQHLLAAYRNAAPEARTAIMAWAVTVLPEKSPHGQSGSKAG